MYTPILKALGLQILIDIWRLFVTYNKLKKQKYRFGACDKMKPQEIRHNKAFEIMVTLPNRRPVH